MIKLLGIVLVAVGFAFRVNTLLVVLTAGLTTGLIAGFSLNELMAMIGQFFVEQRNLTLPIVLMVPVIGVLERHGLQQRVATLIRGVRAATAGRVLWLYQALRGVSSMFGLNLGNHASMVRPLIAPMAEAAAQKQKGEITPAERTAIRAHAATSENVGNFFSDDIVVAVGAILLIKGFFETAGVEVSLRDLKLWGLPTALWVLVVGWWRYARLDRRLAQKSGGESAMTLLTLELFFRLVGLILFGLAVRIAGDATHGTRWGSAAFWAILAVIFGAGKLLSPVAVGYLVVVLVLLAATKQVTAPRFREPSSVQLEGEAARLGNRLLGPVLLVPAVAVIGGFVLGDLHVGGITLVETKPVSQIALGLGCVVAMIWATRLTRERPVTTLDEGGRLLQLISWTLILPQMLAALGGIFARAGVGTVIAQLVAASLPVQFPLVAVVAYCAGMVIFTVLLGNAFAAFPIMTLGIGLPFIVQAHGGNAAIMGALGMLAGYCGTLVTPMAANFNIVPMRLLELPGDFAVIRAQAPFALAIWIFNVAVMYVCVYRF